MVCISVKIRTFKYLWKLYLFNHMVSENDTIYIKRDGVIHSLGKGFISKEEIENTISKRYKHPDTYTYGIFKKLGTKTIKKPEPISKSMTNTEIKKRERIVEKSNRHEHVKSARIIEESIYGINCYTYCTTIRYQNKEVDFCLNINNDVFDSAPISTIDKQIENKIIQLFNEIIDGEAEYMGYDSGYSNRGKRNPYITIYGRTNRESDENIRKIKTEDFVSGIYWTSNNMSPIKMYIINEDIDITKTKEVMLVLDIITETDSYEKINKNIMDQVMTKIDLLESNYDVIVSWIGKINFQNEFNHVCLGLKYD